MTRQRLSPDLRSRSHRAHNPSLLLLPGMTNTKRLINYKKREKRKKKRTLCSALSNEKTKIHKVHTTWWRSLKYFAHSKWKRYYITNKYEFSKYAKLRLWTYLTRPCVPAWPHFHQHYKMNGCICTSTGEVKRFTLTAIHKKENSSSLQHIITSRPRITSQRQTICSCISSRGEKGGSDVSA